MTAFNAPNASAYDTLLTRRSVKAKDMRGSGVEKSLLTKILEAGLRVPDHGKLTPWRYIVLEGEDRFKLGRLIKEALIAEGEANEQVADKMQGYATQGPTLVIAVYSPSTAKPIPEWEQMLSAGASVMNMLVAATALGVASQWLTGWASFSPTVMAGLGLKEDEKIAGLVFFGDHPETPPDERPRPSINEIVEWGFPAEGEA